MSFDKFAQLEAAINTYGLRMSTFGKDDPDTKLNHLMCMELVRDIKAERDAPSKFPGLVARLRDADAEDLMTTSIVEEATDAIEVLEAEVGRLTKIIQATPFHNGNSAKHWNELAVHRHHENCALEAQLTAAQGQIPRDDISLALLERLSKTLTRLGYATPEGGMEHFNAVLPHQLYNLCRGIDGVLDKIAAPIPQQPETSVPAWKSQLEAVVDIYFDGTENPEEHRTYVGGTFAEVMNDSRAMCAAAPIPQQVAEPSVPEGWKQAVALAYGHLWHVNNEPMAPIPLRSSETAAYAARKQLRDLLTHEERGIAINQVQALLAAAPQPKDT